MKRSQHSSDRNRHVRLRSLASYNDNHGNRNTRRDPLRDLLLTKTLVIAGEPGTFTLPAGRKGAMLRAYNKATGQEVGAIYLPAQQSGTPMTHMINGRQYVVVAVGGNGYAGELIAFRLPG